MNEQQAALELEGEKRAMELTLRNTFEDECIDLLCKQENFLSQLDEAKAQGRSLDSLDLAKKMVMEFLDFAESHFDDATLHDTGKRLHDVYQQTKDLEKMLLGQSFKRLRSIIGITVAAEEDIARHRDELRDKYVELYGEFFAICVDRFDKESLARPEFAQSVDLFICELGTKW